MSSEGDQPKPNVLSEVLGVDYMERFRFKKLDKGKFDLATFGVNDIRSLMHEYKITQ